MQARARVRVQGRVQGVGFRYFALQHARRLGVRGYVRNCPDGSVEVLAEGDRTALEELLALLRQGPPAARVDSCHAEWEPYEGNLPPFQIVSFSTEQRWS
jgi:acylphosphatase